MTSSTNRGTGGGNPRRQGGPWTEGPSELLKHAVDHLELGSDFDRRIAMISVDNAIEVTIRTWLGLPARARGCKGPPRRELEEASNSFPALLDLLERFAAAQLAGIQLDDIEWYHRLRNQLYHEGNGITVERAKVEAYLQIGRGMYEALFGEPVALVSTSALQTQTGRFMAAWNDTTAVLRSLLPAERQGPIYYRKAEYLHQLDPALRVEFEALSKFRNALVHGSPRPETADLTAMISRLEAFARRLGTVRPH